jgi:tol-pal system protein YbgF
MRTWRERDVCARALRAMVLAMNVLLAVSACSNGERAQRDREIAALRSQVEDIRKGLDANKKELSRLSGEMKALDAQSAFVIGEVKASAEERARVKASLEDNSKALQALQSAVGELSKPSTTPPAPAAPAAVAPDATPEQIYATGLASLQADEYDRAVPVFAELTRRFPQHALASNAQYWIGEAYYRQRDFARALAEFEKVADVYPKSAQVPEALLKVGMCYRELQDQPRARDTWERVIKEYPGTNAANQAGSLLTGSGGASRPTQ